MTQNAGRCSRFIEKSRTRVSGGHKPGINGGVGTLARMPKGEYLQYGGQAIIEGVMMRSPRFFAVACRAPNKKIVVKTEALEKTWIGRQKWLKWPFLRGSLAIIDGMALGVKAMRFAGNVQVEPAYAVDGSEVAPITAKDQKIQNVAIAGALLGGLAIGFLIFNVLPNFIAETLLRGQPGILVNYVTEITKLIFFILYIWGISLLPDIREVFKYHGAEHKAINTLEATQALQMDNCRAQTRLHPRCGTSFAVIVIIVSFMFMPLVPRYPVTGGDGPLWLDVMVRVGVEFLILPLIAGLSYELLRIAGKFRNQRFVMAAFTPGLMTQYITTKEPEDHQIVVALESLKAVVDAEETGQVAHQEVVEIEDDYYREFHAKKDEETNQVSQTAT